MIFRLIPFLLLIGISCKTTSNSAEMKSVAEENKDIIVLSYLIQDYMRKTRSTNFTLKDILKNDTLERISKNFSSIEVDYSSNFRTGGYAVYFKFANSRNTESIRLTSHERIPWKVKTKKEFGKTENKLDENFDGEIYFHYEERFYNIVKIIVKSPE